MSDDNHRNGIDRRKVLRTAGAAVGGGLGLGATGTAAASGGRSTGDCYVKEISNDGELIVTLVKIFGEKYLFKEAAKYRNADDVSALADDKTYEVTQSGHPVEFGKIDSSVSASDLDSDGTITPEGVDFTPENFIEDYDVDFKQICNGCCGDIAWNSHYALEFHLEGAGGFSGVGVAGIASILCWAAAATTAIPTGGASGALAAGVCGMVTYTVDQLIDVEMIPNSVEMSVAFWDQDETNYWGMNTSPTIAVGLAPGYYNDWNETPKIGEYDKNIHLWG